MMASCTSTKKEDIVDWKELYLIQVDDKVGFINEKGKLVIEPQFDHAYYFFGDNVCYARIGERNGLIGTDGKFVAELDTTISWIYQFRKGVTTFIENNGKEGIISKSGEIILPPIYKKIINDNGHGFIVEDTLGNRGYVNNEGRFIVPCKYDDVGEMQDGMMVVATSSKCGYVDSTGIWVIDSIYDDARCFGNGFARVLYNEKWLLINKEGRQADFEYDEILTGFSCNRAFIRHNQQIKMINIQGQVVCTIDADSIYSFSNGYATFKKSGKCGKIDTTGVVIIKPIFETLYKSGNGLSVYEKNKKQGVVDSVGNIIIQAKYKNILVLDSMALLICINENELTYYDKSGHLIWNYKIPKTTFLPEKPSKEDCIKYFDSRLSELDPIEGVYYVTFNNYSIDRSTEQVYNNSSSSHFYAVIRDLQTDNFKAVVIDSVNKIWVKKFVHIGESNMYAVVNNGTSDWAENGKLILEDSNKFEITLRTGGNDYYNWYVRCEFIKDYPSSAVYEQIQKAEWTGSGFAIADGYIATNYHVINGAKTIYIKGINGNIKDAYRGYVTATDREHDLAIIQIVDKKFDSFDDIPYALGGKSASDIGESVFVLGYPLTQTMGNDCKLTDGIISATSGYKGTQSMFQITAPIQPGNSGGPLFDNDGDVIGIICSKHTDAENVNYAVKVSYLISLCNSQDIDIKHVKGNSGKSQSLSKKAKKVKPFVYLVECNSH